MRDIEPAQYNQSGEPPALLPHAVWKKIFNYEFYAVRRLIYI